MFTYVNYTAATVATQGDRPTTKTVVTGTDTVFSLDNVETAKYIQHPVPLKSLDKLKAEHALPMYLIKRERLRIRKKRRAEEEQDRRDKEVMGLIPPKEPKSKLSNFMRVLGDKAVSDPSKMEMSVLKQIYQRQAEHELNNAKRRLTPAQRNEKSWLKRQEKEQEKTVDSLHMSVFVVNVQLDTKTIVKIKRDMNQWFLTGAIVHCRGGRRRGGMHKLLVQG